MGAQLFNSFYMLLLSMIISIPLGLGAGIYLAEYARDNRLTKCIRLSVESLATVPSIVLGLFGMIIFGVIGIFIRMSRTTNIVYHLLGMLVFSGYFIFDFFRLGHTENTWEKAIQLTMSIYLDFLNFFLHLLQLYAATHHK